MLVKLFLKTALQELCFITVYKQEKTRGKK